MRVLPWKRDKRIDDAFAAERAEGLGGGGVVVVDTCRLGRMCDRVGNAADEECWCWKRIRRKGGNR